MKLRLFIWVMTVLVANIPVFAARVAATLPEVAGKLSKVAAGDTIEVEPGEYADIELKWRSPGYPVVVTSGAGGPVRITGKSSLRLSGDSLTIKGMEFVKVRPLKGNIVEFRIGNEIANASRITECVFNDCNPPRRDIVSSYIVLHGRHNRVDHCDLTGKLSLGVTLLINLNDARSLENHHRIDHNYFGPRPVYGSNGAETMRIGTSQQAYETSATVVEQNYFDRCSGEVEIISVKSSGNVIRGNVFNECEGVVALRHGRGNTVTGNIFEGRNHVNTGGVRIVDSGHSVSGNIFSRLKGYRFFSALAIMNSVPNSLPNRYVRVSDVDVTKNEFIDCTNIEFGTGRDMERTEAPIDCRFTGNVIMTGSESPFTMIDDAAGIEFSDNSIIPVDDKVFSKINSLCEAVYSTAGMRKSDSNVRASEPEIIRLESGVIFRSEPYIISRPTVMIGDGTVLKWNGSGGGNFITLADGAELTVSGITFDGALQQGKGVVRNAISTDTHMLTPYSLKVSACSFINMPESGCVAIKGTKGTFGVSVEIVNCSFSDLSGNAISFADETDDKGRYSAENIAIGNCKFSHMLGIPLNIYRGGSDESTAGPNVSVLNCTFDDCCNRERGSVLRLIGPQVLKVSGCEFNDSGRGGASIRLDETSWEKIDISECVFNNSGRVISNYQSLK